MGSDRTIMARSANGKPNGHATESAVTGRQLRGTPLPDDLLQQASQSIIVYDAAGIVRHWNPASTELYGWPAVTTVGQCLDPLAPAHWFPLAKVGGIAEWHGTVARRRMSGAPIEAPVRIVRQGFGGEASFVEFGRSEEHTSELQSLMRISYAVFCLKKKKKDTKTKKTT